MIDLPVHLCTMLVVFQSANSKSASYPISKLLAIFEKFEVTLILIFRNWRNCSIFQLINVSAGYKTATTNSLSDSLYTYRFSFSCSGSKFNKKPDIICCDTNSLNQKLTRLFVYTTRSCYCCI